MEKHALTGCWTLRPTVLWVGSIIPKNMRLNARGSRDVVLEDLWEVPKSRPE